VQTAKQKERIQKDSTELGLPLIPDDTAAFQLPNGDNPALIVIEAVQRIITGYDRKRRAEESETGNKQDKVLAWFKGVQFHQWLI